MAVGATQRPAWVARRGGLVCCERRAAAASRQVAPAAAKFAEAMILRSVVTLFVIAMSAPVEVPRMHRSAKRSVPLEHTTHELKMRGISLA